jgi:putative nucleotidyltransferase with HDIG domain
MSDPAGFLMALGHALAGMGLYREGHPARERAIDGAYEKLVELQGASARPLFTFLDDETIFGSQPMRDLKVWEWGRRLSHAGIQRLEFEAQVSRDAFEVFLEEVLARLTLQALNSAEARHNMPSGIKFGTVGLKGESEAVAEALPTATLTLGLGEEAEALRWLADQVQMQGTIPMVEAEAIVRSLSVAMHEGREIVLPLLRLKEFDEYTTTHSLNVSVLSMALAEFIGIGGREVRSIGTAGLLHDIGKVKVPIEILNKPGKFTPQERAVMNRHPADGARIILGTAAVLDLAAVVAYEHHVMIDGGGYPAFRFPRDCHAASKLVHVCDVYDALRTNRPYRDAWPAEKTLAYIEERSGTEFDAAYALPFVAMMRRWESRITVLTATTAAPSPR